jgi:hypothetical protein
LIKSKKLGRDDLRKLRIAFFDDFGEKKLDILLVDVNNKNQFKKNWQEAVAV